MRAFSSLHLTWLCLVAAGIVTATTQLHASVPAVVMSNHQTLYSALNNGTQRVSANTRGDVFFHDPYNHQLLELPAGSTTPVVLLKNTNSTTSTTGPSSVDVDSANNLYFNNTYAGRVVKIPYNNGTYPTGIDASDAALKANTCSSGMTVDCVLPTLGVLVGGYAQTSDTALDANGNFYFADVNDSVSSGAYNRIVKLSASGTVTILVDGLKTASNAQLVSDAKGDLYYADGTALYTLPVGASSLAQINASTLKGPTGVTFDPNGNLIVSDSGNSRIVVIPNESGALNANDQYLLAPYYSQNSVGIDGYGTIYYSGSSGGASSISALQSSVYQLAPLAVNSTSTSALVYASFNASVTFSSIFLKTVGANAIGTVNTCVLGTTYTAGKSCSINAQIKPVRVGPVSGYFGVTDNNGVVQGQFAIATSGLGSATAVDPGTVSTVSNAFTQPSGLAVDRGGNVFVADEGANAVYEFAGGTGTPVSVGTGLLKPTSIATDADGDLFIVDSGNARVVEVPSLGGALQASGQTIIISNITVPAVIASGPSDVLYLAQPGQLASYSVRGFASVAMTATLSTAYARPAAIAVDPKGNILLADSAVGDLVLISPYTNIATIVGTGLTSAAGLAVDAAGNAFLSDNGTARVVRVANNGGTLDYANAFSLGTFASPASIALDGSGNAYLIDLSTNALLKITRSLGALGFGSVNLNTTSPEMTASLLSSGNQALTLGTPLYTATGDTTRFAITTNTTCSAGSSLAAGLSCALAATYAPTTKATNSEVLLINASPTVATTPFQVTLTGSGTFQEPTTLGLTYSPTLLSYGQTATFTATLTPQAFNVAAAGGEVTFSINGVTQKPVAIANNSATLQTTALNGGANTVTASYGGDINYAAASATAQTITVSAASTTTTLTVTTGFSNPTSSLTGSGLTLSATVTPSVPGVITGSVQFMSGATTLGTAPLNATTQGTYQATLTTSSIPAGTYSVVAVYPNNANYSGSSSATQSLLVSAQGIQLTSSSTNITATPSTPASVTLSVASVAGLGSPTAAAVTFACSGLPSNAVCYFTPADITLSASPSGSPIAPTSVNLTIKVGVSSGTPLPPVAMNHIAGRMETMLASLFGLPFLLLLRNKRRRRVVPALFSILALVFSISLVGCTSNPAPAATPTGTYPVTVTAISSTAQTSVILNLTVGN